MKRMDKQSVLLAALFAVALAVARRTTTYPCAAVARSAVGRGVSSAHAAVGAVIGAAVAIAAAVAVLGAGGAEQQPPVLVARVDAKTPRRLAGVDGVDTWK